MKHADRGAANGIAIGALALQWLLMVLPAQPFTAANFPINDDWSHQQSVAALVLEGRFVLPDWTATNFIGLLAWAAPFAWLAGPEHEVLRFAGWVAGGLGVVGSFLFLRELGLRPLLACLCAAAIAANPIYLSMSASFMTDIPYAAATTWGLLLATRALRTGSGGAHLGALAFLLLAQLIRQTGLVLLAAYAVSWVVRTGWRGIGARHAAGALLLGALVHFGYPAWLAHQGRLPYMNGAMHAMTQQTLALPFSQVLGHACLSVGRILFYVALGCALPLLLLTPWRSLGVQRGRSLRWHAWVCLLLGIALAALLHRHQVRMPFLGYELFPEGLGLRIHLDRGRPTELLWQGWNLVTAVGALACVGGVALLLSALRSLAVRPAERREDLAVVTLLGLYVVLYLAPVSLLPTVMDRYALAMLVPVAGLLAWAHRQVGPPEPPRPGVGVATALIVAGSFFAAALLHDYFAWNRVRWHALDALQASGVPPTQIQGGFDYTAWKQFRPGQGHLPPPGGWFASLQPYEVALGGRRGYEVTARWPVQDAWLPFSPREILVLRRGPDSTPDR